jgi:isocitrate/isopropylmalate dehydrogenase
MNQKDSDMVLNVALIPGDGIGREVVPEGLRVLEALAERYGFEVKFEAFPYGCSLRLSILPEARRHDAR